MGHGYLGDGYGKYGDRDPDGGRDDDRGSWRGEQRDEWRGGERDRQSGEWRSPQGGSWSDRNQDRSFMFESRQPGQQGRAWDREPRRQDRQGTGGFTSRSSDESRNWFGGDDQGYRQSGDWSGQSIREPRSQNQRFASHQDDHYLSWRQQQMDALDRDYQDYCRERQQQFHQDFSSWRRNRQPVGQAGSQQSGQFSPELELAAQHAMDGTAGTSTDPSNAPQSTIDPESAATLGTNNSENSGTGRGGRR